MAENNKPILSGNEDVDKTAFLNWRTEKGNGILNLLHLADGFMLAAIQAAKAALADNEHKTADVTVFPMLMNVNHSIELYLKAMIWTLNLLAGNPNRIEGSHNIKQIFDTVRSKMKTYHGNLTVQQFDDAMKGLKAYLVELTDKLKPIGKKDKMDFSRYPFDNDYREYFYVTEMNNVEIDLENFIVRFEEIHQQLEQLTDFLFYQELNQQW
jgi:hypothetical protein